MIIIFTFSLYISFEKIVSASFLIRESINISIH